jgi:hypothetical protein
MNGVTPRSAAAEAFAIREALAEALERHAARHVTVYGATVEVEVELRTPDAHELARDLIEYLADRGFALVRRDGP